VNAYLERLKPKERRGSKARCHLLTHGSAEKVAATLTALASPFARVTASDRWMPNGFLEPQEAELDKAPQLLDAAIRSELGAWWLPVGRQSARTPNFDIAATCKVTDTPGLLLIEAKAHDEELRKEEAGRILKIDDSSDRKASHGTIGMAIASAAAGLAEAIACPCSISRDSHYQMSNRFAWAWKLTELGVPVVLVYLGFLKAEEMRDRGAIFSTHDEWLQLVKSHSASLFKSDPWDRAWMCNKRSLVPLIRSTTQPLGHDSPALP
jgi:hypothetical protein